jgi:hypothetical protein
MLKRIISGGQPGVEIAALDAAIKLNIPHEGWAYKRRKTENGVLPEYDNVKEIGKPSYSERLEKNIIDSEGTVILTHGRLILGSKMIKNLADKHKKPCLHVDLSEYPLNRAISLIRKWMINNEIGTVYFTGSKPSGAPNINEEVIQIIEGICRWEIEQKRLPRFGNQDNPTKL